MSFNRLYLMIVLSAMIWSIFNIQFVNMIAVENPECPESLHALPCYAWTIVAVS